MKRKFILFFFSILLTGLLHASDSTKVKPFKRFYAGVSFTGNVAFRYREKNYLPSGATAAQESDVLKWRNKHEHPQWGFQAGVRVGVRVTRVLSFETGIEYNYHSNLLRTDNLPYGSQWFANPDYDALVGSTVKVIENYHYFNIPLGINFSLGKRKFKVGVVTGVNFNFLLKKTSRFETSASTNVFSDRSLYRSFNISPFLGIGMEWHISKSLFLRIMPTGQMQVLKNINAPITEHLATAGINASLYFGFKKVK